MKLNTIISAGRSDTERTALKVARHSGMDCHVSADPVNDADGILMLTHGPMNFKLKKIKDRSKRFKKQCLHINLKETPAHTAPYEIDDWMGENNIHSLYVTGPDQSDSPDIIESTRLVIDGLIMISKKSAYDIPEDEISGILKDLSLREKNIIAHMNAIDLDVLHGILESHLEENRHGHGETRAIFKEIWSRLAKSHRLKIVK